eukprot:TRINITY_DN5953_c0_g2_i1.p1 TRINITY_DN5953_c0_g2~~TRINITY_DN5953_c0_g2_i1.p1  ORF type:complete len:207 (-),score=17.95 TRINITY_DN5953_c0_g2_i1:121-741(-)
MCIRDSPSTVLIKSKENLATIKELPEATSTINVSAFNMGNLTKEVNVLNKGLNTPKTLDEYLQAFEQSNAVKPPSIDAKITPPTRNTELAKYSLSADTNTERTKKMGNVVFGKGIGEEIGNKDHVLKATTSPLNGFNLTNDNNNFAYLMDQKYKECLEKFKYNREWFEYQVDNDSARETKHSTLRGRTCTHGKVYTCYKCNKSPTS